MCIISTTCLIVSPSWLLIVIILSSPPKARRFSILQQPQVILLVCLPKKEENLYNTNQTQQQQKKRNLWSKYTLFGHSNADCQNVKWLIRARAFLWKCAFRWKSFDFIWNSTAPVLPFLCILFLGIVLHPQSLCPEVP